MDVDSKLEIREGREDRSVLSRRRVFYGFVLNFER